MILDFPTKHRAPLMTAEVRSIPIVKQALFFLNHAGEKKGITLTERGFLGRNFVQAFWDEHLRDPEGLRFRPTREVDCSDATRIYRLLEESKYVRKFKGAIQLTARGRAALESDSCRDLYRNLFEMGMFRWNWAFQDGYSDFSFIQDSAPRPHKLSPTMGTQIPISIRVKR